MSNGMTRREREITDINKIIEILDKSKITHKKRIFVLYIYK